MQKDSQKFRETIYPHFNACSYLANKTFFYVAYYLAMPDKEEALSVLTKIEEITDPYHLCPKKAVIHKLVRVGVYEKPKKSKKVQKQKLLEKIKKLTEELELLG